MKRIILLLAVAVFAISTKGQQYDSSNSLKRRAFVQYTKNAKGMYEKKEDVTVDVVSNIVRLYAYNKNTKEFMLKRNMVIMLFL